MFQLLDSPRSLDALLSKRKRVVLFNKSPPVDGARARLFGPGRSVRSPPNRWKVVQPLTHPQCTVLYSDNTALQSALMTGISAASLQDQHAGEARQFLHLKQIRGGWRADALLAAQLQKWCAYVLCTCITCMCQSSHHVDIR